MLTITDYKNWALNDQRTAVALNGGGNALVSESDRMGGITRMFCRGAVKKMRGDVLADFTRALSARGETIPAPGARLTAAQKSLFRSIALEGGNFEVQKMNTAIAGFKTGSIKSVTERLGGSEYRQFHRGGSDHVNV